MCYSIGIVENKIENSVRLTVYFNMIVLIWQFNVELRIVFCHFHFQFTKHRSLNAPNFGKNGEMPQKTEIKT